MMDQKIEQPVELPDTVLISRILAGEKRLFEAIIRRYNQRLFRIGMSILNDDMETEDAMQTAYIKAYEHLAEFENRSSLGTWLIRIMLNICLALKKKNQRFINEPELHLVNNSIMTTPAHILANKELNSVLENAIAQLPEKYRLVFVLREIEELSVKETTEALGIEESNVKVRLNRAKTMLKDHLNEYMKDNVYSFHLSRCDRIVDKVLGSLKIS
ncbi:MAG TPA: RNA polymerase sigma factor [Flavipsychrobacter sp.]|nr:RNA polymerase sigma factor [Flavipsychrobacter sp.]